MEFSEIKRRVARGTYEMGALEFGEFILESGIKTPYVINYRKLPSYRDLVDDIGATIGDIILDSEKPDRLCGIPQTGLYIAEAVGTYTRIPAVHLRKDFFAQNDVVKFLKSRIDEGSYSEKALPGIQIAIADIESLKGLKPRGIATYVDGDLRNGDNVCIIDDVIARGGSKNKAIKLLKLEAERREIEINITKVRVAFDREQGGREELEKKGVGLDSILSIREAAKILYDDHKIDSDNYNTIVEYTISQRKALGLSS